MLRICKTLLLFLLATAPGCATSGQTTLLGLGLGSLAGGAIGALADAGKNGRWRVQNTFIGSTIGGASVAAMANLLHPKDSKKKEMADLAAETNALMKPKKEIPAPSDHPLLLPPQVETRYVDDQIRGNTFVPGHLEYQITQPGQWSRE